MADRGLLTLRQHSKQKEVLLFVGSSNRRRIKKEEKAKVVAAVCLIYFTPGQFEEYDELQQD